MAEILAVKSLWWVVGGFQSIAWSQPQSGLAVTKGGLKSNEIGNSGFLIFLGQFLKLVTPLILNI